jgi:hypothetical protein
MGIKLPHGAGTPSDIDIDASAKTHRLDVRASLRRARLLGWKLPITDGPFAESKEMLGGGSGGSRGSDQLNDQEGQIG